MVGGEDSQVQTQVMRGHFNGHEFKPEFKTGPEGNFNFVMAFWDTKYKTNEPADIARIGTVLVQIEKWDWETETE